MHTRLAPRTYLEIGIRNGGSLALSRVPSIAIDPAYSITAELRCPVSLFRTISDEYFARPEPLAPWGGLPVDLAFIDGLHLFEYALRDLMHVERHSSPYGMAVFDDVFPRTAEEAARDRHTRSWTGDVFKVLPVLQRFRPDLVCVRVGTQPTGLLLVLGLDPTSTVLRERYDAIVAQYVTPDPQQPPDELMQSLLAHPPGRVLQAQFWDVLRTAREQGADPAATRDSLRSAVAAALGGVAR